MKQKFLVSFCCSVVLFLGCLTLIMKSQSGPALARSLGRSEAHRAAASHRRVPNSHLLSRLHRRKKRGRVSTQTPLTRPAAPQSSVAKAIHSLAQGLDVDHFSRVDWTNRAEALAQSLGMAALPELWVVAADRTRPIEELVAAAECIRHLAPTAGIDRQRALPEATLNGLRQAFENFSDDTALGEAATRSLVAFGDAEDRDHLVDRLVSGETPAERQAASWGLEVADDPAIADVLASLVRDPPDSTTALLAVAALDGMASKGGVREARAAVVHALELALQDADKPLALRQRAVTTLGSLGGEAARDYLLETVRESSELGILESASWALVDLADEDSVHALSQMAFNPELPADTQVAAAETIARAAARSDLDEQSLNVAVDRLSHVLSHETDARKRRRAALALAEAGDPTVLPQLADTLLRDPDARVREGAVVSLSRLDYGGNYAELLERVAREDSSPEVREQATQVLEVSYESPK